MIVSEFVTLIRTAAGVSLPTFGWVVLGFWLYRLGFLPQHWVAGFSRFAFRVILPLLLFAGAVQVDYGELSDSMFVLVGVAATLLVTLFSWAYSGHRGWALETRGVFVQASFRSNLAIVGYALCISAYGERGGVLAALPIALLTLLYNVLAVWILGVTHGSDVSAAGIARGIARNPLIIGIAAGVFYALSGMPVPQFAGPWAGWLASLFLPLMLICVGASMNLATLRSAAGLVWEATAWRLVLAPALAVALAVTVGVGGEALGVLYLLLSSPVASASFVMVVAARGDGEMAANMVVVSTLCSLITVTAGFFLLVLLGLAATPVEGAVAAK